MFCSECGHKNEEGAKFCEKCGASLTSNNKVKPKTKVNNKKDKKKSRKLIIIILIVVILVGLISLFGYKHFRGKKDNIPKTKEVKKKKNTKKESEESLESEEESVLKIGAESAVGKESINKNNNANKAAPQNNNSNKSNNSAPAPSGNANSPSTNTPPSNNNNNNNNTRQVTTTPKEANYKMGSYRLTQEDIKSMGVGIKGVEFRTASYGNVCIVNNQETNGGYQTLCDYKVGTDTITVKLKTNGNEYTFKVINSDTLMYDGRYYHYQ